MSSDHLQVDYPIFINENATTYKIILLLTGIRGSQCSDYSLDGLGFLSWHGSEIYPFSKPFRPNLGPT